VLAHAAQDESFNPGRNLFLKEAFAAGFLTAPTVPAAWRPGDELLLRGPLGRGFQLPESVHRLALVALGGTSGRIYPLAAQAIASDNNAVLFCRSPHPALPAALEVQPLSGFAEVIQWADFIALDVPLDALPELRAELGLGLLDKLSSPAQVLVHTAMPCGKLAECGACAVPMRRGWKLACKDGPVFDLNKIEW
jgi:hypothetical protein